MWRARPPRPTRPPRPAGRGGTAARRSALARSDLRAAVESNAAFHEVLVDLAGRPVLASVMEPVAGRMRWLLSHTRTPRR